MENQKVINLVKLVAKQQNDHQFRAKNYYAVIKRLKVKHGLFVILIAFWMILNKLFYSYWPNRQNTLSSK